MWIHHDGNRWVSVLPTGSRRRPLAHTPRGTGNRGGKFHIFSNTGNSTWAPQFPRFMGTCRHSERATRPATIQRHKELSSPRMGTFKLHQNAASRCLCKIRIRFQPIPLLRFSLGLAIRGGKHMLYPFIKRIMSITQSEQNRFASRSPKRITITIPHYTFQKIVHRSNEEGRSLSNLAAFILEQGLQG